MSLSCNRFCWCSGAVGKFNLEPAVSLEMCRHSQGSGYTNSFVFLKADYDMDRILNYFIILSPEG